MQQQIARVVRRFILRNELAHTRSGLEMLVAWLREVADDFEAHGCNVRDIRMVIAHFNRELRRRAGKGGGLSLLVLVLLACGTQRIDRERQLAQCRLVSLSRHDVQRCLTIEKDWSADSATAAGLSFQKLLDSARVSCYRLVDSIYREQFGRNRGGMAESATREVIGNAQRRECGT